MTKKNQQKTQKRNAKKRKTLSTKLSRQRINLIHHRNLSVTSFFIYFCLLVPTSVIPKLLSYSIFNFVDISISLENENFKSIFIFKYKMQHCHRQYRLGGGRSRERERERRRAMEVMESQQCVLRAFWMRSTCTKGQV